jgi:hypothetical protein
LLTTARRARWLAAAQKLPPEPCGRVVRHASIALVEGYTDGIIRVIIRAWPIALSI